VLVAMGELLDDDGALPLDVARGIFAATVAPLPGVEPLLVAGETPHDFAGAAARRLARGAAELDPAVAAAVAAALEPAADDVWAEVEVGYRPRGEGDAGVEPDHVPSADELRAVVGWVITDLEARSGHDLRLPVRSIIVARERIRALGMASGVYGEGPDPVACRLQIAASTFGLDTPSIMSTIAHEVWHCFQLDANPAAFGSGPMWLIEGQAEWVGERYVDGSPSSALNWDTWLLLPEQPLTRRSYDALGLFAVADADGGAWPDLLGMLGRGRNAAVETLFATSALNAVRAEAMAFVRFPEHGPEWESTGPGITDASTELRLTAPAGGGIARTELTVGAFGALPVRLDASAGEVLYVTVVGGAGSIAMPGTVTTPLDDGVPAGYCLLPGGCECPDGSLPGGASTVSAEPGIAAVAVGSVSGGDLAVVAESLSVEEACERSRLIGQWGTDVALVMAAFAGVYGTLPPCTGPWLTTFATDGSWSAGYEATCTLGGVPGTGTAVFTGRYVDSGEGTFTVSGVTGEGVLTLNGVTMPMPGLDGFRSALGGTVDYAIHGDVLEYYVETPEGDRVRIVLDRVA